MRRGTLGVALAAFAFAIWLPGDLAAQAPELFSPGSATAPAPALPEAGALRSRVVEIDLAGLERVRRALRDQPAPAGIARSSRASRAGGIPAPGSLLRFNPFGDAVVNVVFERTAPTFSGGYSLSGHPVGQPFGQATLVVNGAVVSGTIRVPGAPYRTFELRTIGESGSRRYLVSEVTEPDFVCEDWDEETDGRGASLRDMVQGSAPPRATLGEPRGAAPLPDPPPPSSTVSASTSTRTVIDIVLVYSRQLKARLGGDAQTVAKIEEMVASTNTMFTNSGVSAALNLVAVQGVDYDETGGVSDAQRLLVPDDGHMDEVHALRDRVHADVYGLIRSACCGRAQVLIDRSVSNAWRAILMSFDVDHVFAHELGHVMGLRHDRYADCGDTCPQTVEKDAFGYVNQALFVGGTTTKPTPAPHQDKQWRTNMARFDQCRNYAFCHVNFHFSNPAISYSQSEYRTGRRNAALEDPIGIALTETNANVVTPDGPANAARVLNLTRDYVAGYRTGRAVKVSFDGAAASATEGGAAATVTVNLDAPPGRSVSVPFTVASSDAWPHDYGVSGALSFGATDTSSTLTVTAADDDADDDGETIALTFGDLPNGVSAGAVSSVTVSLIDDDTVSGAPEVDRVAFFSTPANGRAYGAGEDIEASVVFTKSVTVTGTPTLELQVGANARAAACGVSRGEVLACSYTVVKGDNDANGVSIGTNSLALPPGAAIRDSANQDADPNHSAVGGASSQSVKTTSAEATLAVSPNPVTEGQGATVTASLSAALSAPVTIPLITTAGTAEAGDYTVPASVAIAPGDLSGAWTFATALDADLDDETLTVSLGTLPSTVAPGTPSSVAVTIADVTAEVTLQATPNPVTEGSSAAVTATLSKAVGAAVTIPLTATAGTAEAADYTAPASVSVAAGETSGTAALSTTRDIDLNDETVTVALRSSLPSPLVVGTPSRVTVTIEDATPQVTLSAAPNPVAEGSSTTIEATLSKAWSANLTIPLSVTAGTAEAGDWTRPASIAITAGQTSGAAALSTADDSDLDDETLTVALGSLPSGIVAGSPSSVAVAIRDTTPKPPDTPSVSLGIAPASVAEGSAARVTATLSKTLTESVTIPLTVTAGTAEAGDWTDPAAITIAGGELSAETSLATVADADRDAETLTVALGALPASVKEGTPSSVELTITDATVRPGVSLAVSPNPVNEGSAAVVTASLSASLSRAVTIPLTVTLGTAEAADVDSLAAVTIAAGGRSVQAALQTRSDDDRDAETLTVALGALPDEVKAGTPSSVAVTITDTTPAPPGSGGGGGGGGGTPPPPPPTEPPGPPPPPPGERPKAVLTTGVECDDEPCRVVTGEPVRFFDLSTGTVHSRRWEFGDGTSSGSPSPAHDWERPGFYEVRLIVSNGVSESEASMMFLVEAAAPDGECAHREANRCLRNSRYEIAVDWFTADGRGGPATVVHAGTDDSGLFRFFDGDNWEVLVKVLDGCETNGHVWVFAASTTDLGYVIRVTDTMTGDKREYGNEAGNSAPAITDVKAFASACGPN